MQPRPIKGIVKEVLEELGQDKDTKESQVLDVWPEVVGKRATKHTRPVVLKDEKLTVNVDTSGWLYELSPKKIVILEKLKKRVGPHLVKEISFRVGEV